MDERGNLTVTWRSLAAPWAKYRVRVDGVEMARVGWRKPAAIDLPSGRHEVQLFGPRGRYTSHQVSVDIRGQDRVDLFGRTGRLPAGMTRRREISQWAKENSIWLGTVDEKPPVSEYARPFSTQRLAVHVVALALFALFAVTATQHHRWVSLALALVMIAGSGLMIRLEIARRRRPI